MSSAPLTILCLASYEKGYDFLREAKRQGCRVLLLTSESLKDSHRFPSDCFDEIFFMPDVQKKWDREDTMKAVAFLARTREIHRIVPLDDFDLEMAASLREHLRLSGMGETTTRYFRDKLAMRMQAREHGLTVPDFVHVLNHQAVHRFTERVRPPWVLKPRMLAGAIGIKLVHSAPQLWDLVNQLGDEQPYYLVEQYIAGDVYHVDSFVYNRELRFAVASRYGAPPMDVSQKGGIFTTQLLERGSEEELSLLAKNRRVQEALGLLRGVSHTEFIRSREDGTVYFLETAARVGGAHIADLVEAATGMNPWREWAKIEIAGGEDPYEVDPPRLEYAGLLVSLARQEFPDTSHFTDPEIVWRMDKKHHVGFIVRSQDYKHVGEILESLIERVKQQYWASAPALERPGD